MEAMTSATPTGVWRTPPRLRDLPWAGSGLGFSRRPLTFLSRAHDGLGSDIVRFGYFGKTIYSLRGREATELFFASPALDLKAGFVEIFGGLLPKRFIAGGSGDEELYAFSKKRAVFNFGAYLDCVRVSTSEVLRELGQTGEIDLFELSSQLSFRSASRFMVGEMIMSPGFFGRWRELFFATNPLEALGRFQWNLLNPLFWRRQNELFAQLEELLGRVIDARPSVAPGSETSYLDLGLNTIYREKSRRQVVGHIYMMFLAAYLNPTLTLGWTLTDLMEHAPYRRRVLDEMATVTAGQSGPLAQQTLEGLQVLQLCAMETLRVRVKAVNVRKVIDQPFVFRDYQLPVGALVCNSPTFAQMSAENYERPEEFWPERWLGTEELERSSMTARYMPFGTFAHICPGKRFSHLALKHCVVELFRRFELERVGPCPAVREGIMPVLGDRDGPCLVRYFRRR
jgi:sterol 14-demethylase